MLACAASARQSDCIYFVPDLPCPGTCDISSANHLKNWHDLYETQIHVWMIISSSFYVAPWLVCFWRDDQGRILLCNSRHRSLYSLVSRAGHINGSHRYQARSCWWWVRVYTEWSHFTFSPRLWEKWFAFIHRVEPLSCTWIDHNNIQDTCRDATDIKRGRAAARYVCILRDHFLHFSPRLWENWFACIRHVKPLSCTWIHHNII